MDTSSSASIAAYINSLTYSLDSDNKWFGLAHNTWSISRCVFCTFNAFSGKDVRVEAKIPGGVKSFVIDLLGVRSGTDADSWQEAFLSSILRSIQSNLSEGASEDNGDECMSNDSCKDGENNWMLYKSSAKRTMNILYSLQTEMKFLEAATKLFPLGRHLGSPKGPHLAGNHDNHLTLGLVNYFCSSGRPEIAVGFLKPFIEKDPLLNGPMMECLLAANNQSLAIALASAAHTAESCVPSGQLADFLVSRGDFGRAEVFASDALKQCPTDFSNWFRLISIKVSLEQYESALNILNNAPMYGLSASSQYGEFYRILPKPVAISLPLAGPQGDEDSGKGTRRNGRAIQASKGSAQVILEKLKASTLQGTFKGAYRLLVRICYEMGWDDLLETRSRVFIMEREISNAVDDDATSKISVTNDFLKDTGKKLCERWLDNLFLILFEDLRIFELFKEELSLAKASLVSNGLKKSLKEWAMIGKLCERLGHQEEAKMAFQKCLLEGGSSEGNFVEEDGEFGPLEGIKSQQMALNRLVSLYAQEGKIQLALMCSLRLLNLQERIFDESIHPTALSKALCVLIRQTGLRRVLMELEGIKGTGGGSDGHETLMKLMDFYKDAKIHGYDY